MTEKELEAKITRLEDVHEIKNLQARYNHYVTARRPDKIMGLFPQKEPNPTKELSDSGVFVGLEKIRSLCTTQLRQSPETRGNMSVAMVMSPVIEVNQNGKTAKGMWHLLACFTRRIEKGPLALWHQGKYDNEYVKEDGKWKFKSLRYITVFFTPFDKGWVKKPIAGSMTSHLIKSDRPSTMPLPYNSERFNDFMPLPPEPPD